MRAVECPREAEVLEAVASQRWPDRVDAALRSHVAGCAVCADVAAVAAALQGEQEHAWSDAVQLPPAHVVWFRAQARARAEAARQAARPIAIMQALGFACAAALFSALIGVIARWVWTRADGLRAAAWLQSLPTAELLPADALSLAVRGILLAIGLWLVLAPVAVYLVAADD